MERRAHGFTHGEETAEEAMYEVQVDVEGVEAEVVVVTAAREVMM